MRITRAPSRCPAPEGATPQVTASVWADSFEALQNGLVVSEKKVVTQSILSLIFRSAPAMARVRLRLLFENYARDYYIVGEFDDSGVITGTGLAWVFPGQAN